MNLHERNPVGRFDNRVADYARYRPGYPDEAIDAMLDGLGDPASLVAADVGAGTGISARAVAARGVSVIAIEPNAGMRAAAEPAPRIEWRDATAEQTGLADASVDLIVAAQSWHWFHPEDAPRELSSPSDSRDFAVSEIAAPERRPPKAISAIPR